MENSMKEYKEIYPLAKEMMEESITEVLHKNLLVGMSNVVAVFKYDRGDLFTTVRFSAPCYGWINGRSNRSETKLVCMKAFFPKTAQMFGVTFSYEEFKKDVFLMRLFNWLVNESVFRDVFMTKDIDEGFDRGFEISTQYLYEPTLMAMQLLRSLFERNNISVFKALGEVLKNELDIFVYHSYFMSGCLYHWKGDKEDFGCMVLGSDHSIFNIRNGVRSIKNFLNAPNIPIHPNGICTFNTAYFTSSVWVWVEREWGDSTKTHEEIMGGDNIFIPSKSTKWDYNGLKEALIQTFPELLPQKCGSIEVLVSKNQLVDVILPYLINKYEGVTQ